MASIEAHINQIYARVLAAWEAAGSPVRDEKGEPHPLAIAQVREANRKTAYDRYKRGELSLEDTLEQLGAKSLLTKGTHAKCAACKAWAGETT